jgi:uncharacterized membrane-anchored protein
MKKPFLHAFAAALYVAGIVGLITFFSTFLKNKPDTVVIPMTMLSLFVLSAAVMGYLFLSESIYLLMENKKKEATSFFFKVVGFFACFVALFSVAMVLTKFF